MDKKIDLDGDPEEQFTRKQQRIQNFLLVVKEGN